MIFIITEAAKAKENFNPVNSNGVGYSCKDANDYCSITGCSKNDGGNYSKCVKVECGGRYKVCLKTGTYYWRLFPKTKNLEKK
jgi:hypothetical protein